MDHDSVSATTAPSSNKDDELVPLLSDDHELFTHIILEGFPIKNGQFVSAGPTVKEARTPGTAKSSLCGKSWIPSRRQSDCPLCRTCVERAEEFEWPIPYH